LAEDLRDLLFGELALPLFFVLKSFDAGSSVVHAAIGSNFQARSLSRITLGAWPFMASSSAWKTLALSEILSAADPPRHKDETTAARAAAHRRLLMLMM
jgi:hypothetical protein